MDFKSLAGIAEALREAGKVLKALFANWGFFFRRNKSKQDSQNGDKAVENGDVDKINDILRNKR